MGVDADAALDQAADARPLMTVQERAAARRKRDAVAAQQQLALLAKEWSASRGTDVVVAHAAMAEPDVATALATLERDRGALPVVASYVLFPGVLHDRITAAAGGLEASPPLGDDVGDLVLARVDALS